MEGSSSSWQLALATDTVGGSLGRYLCHVKAENLAYTLVRSILFVSPVRIDEVFDIIHGLEHSTNALKQQSKTVKQDHPILLYWQDKVAICDSCTSFLSELLASSWRHHGPSISGKNSSRFQFSNLNCEAAAIMGDLFKYMSAAYERLEKETKDALQAESHSSAFSDACTEYFGQNFEKTQDPERLSKLLYNLHETNAHILLMRLAGGQHIEDTIETDKKALSKRTTSGAELTLALFKDTESQVEQEPAPTLTKGKNYINNKKRAERKKRQRATVAENGEVEGVADPSESLKETMDNSAASAEHHDESILEGENVGHISQDSTVIEDLDITYSAASTERVTESSVENDVAVSPTVAERSVKMDCTSPPDFFETPGSSSSPVHLDSVAAVVEADVQNQKSPYEYEQYLEDALETGDTHSWTQVVGNRKKFKKSSRSGVNPDAPPINVSPRFARRVNNSRGDGKVGTALGIAPSSALRAHTSALLLKQQTVSKSNSTLINSKSSGSTKSAKSKVGILPSVPETATASTTSIVRDSHCSPASSATFTDLKVVVRATTTVSVDDSTCITKKAALSSPSKSVGSATVSSKKYLKPFNKKVKMSDTSETTLAATITPLTDTFSLVESLRDAGVEDDALSSLVPKASALTMSSTHLPLPNVGGCQHRSFSGKSLDVRRANNLPASAGNSPVPPQPEKTPVYHYPPPDVLTPENQEILDLIIKGGPAKKYPRVGQSAADKEKSQQVSTPFVTKPAVTTYEGKDAYEVLGDRCPAPLTLKDHPNVNKCIHQGEIFHCAYCRVEVSGNADAEKCIICPGCGPCSEIRYCQRSHLLADSINHFEICGKKTASYPLMWSELPLHYQSLYPYIKPLTGTLTAHCFRQMAHCLVINSDGIIQNPFKAFFEVQMAPEDKAKAHNYVHQMYQFQDHGYYYLFHPSPVAGGVDIEITISMPDGSGGCYREDQRFARVRNACFLTADPKLLAVFYRRIKDVIMGYPERAERISILMDFFNLQFHAEFPSFRLAGVARLDKDYTFQGDWGHVRHMVHDLELANPILRAWITEDAEDADVPADPAVRYQGSHWDLVHGPTFRAGSADRKDWGAGWSGLDEKKWQKQLDRKYARMVADELAKVETELEGDII